MLMDGIVFRQYASGNLHFPKDEHFAMRFDADCRLCYVASILRERLPCTHLVMNGYNRDDRLS